ncbi:cleavage and polyadenylation specificity factor 160 [Actinidia rufa]|uniref:Cleavage and polyadenylation specificity factor 160 n=1 Tax=Actinidia rufa TaxID=165716 RepID=A0A7J0EFC1_9ERIC|nr:cleavage and polyadenylation specificity factor 160 [Actinidia rufa]
MHGITKSAAIPLKCTPHQVTCFAEKNLYPLIVSVPLDPVKDVAYYQELVLKPLNQVLSSLVDQEAEKSDGPWQTRATIPMQSSENALTVRVVTLYNTTTKENKTLLAIGTAYVQEEDVAARGRVLLFSIGRNPDNSQTSVSEVYSKELKGAISALASLQGHLLIASGPTIILHKWTGSELNGVAFFDAPPLYVVSLNIVRTAFIVL